MFALHADGDDGPWGLAGLGSKAEVPVEEMLVVTGQCARRPMRQLTCLGGHVRASSARRLLLLLPLPTTTSASVAPVIQILEVGECAVHLLQDVKACFPSLVRKSPLARAVSDSDSDSDDGDGGGEGGDDAGSTRRQHGHRDDPTPAAPAMDPATVNFIALTRVKVLNSLDEFFHAYSLESPHELRKAIQDDPLLHGAGHPQLLCIEFPRRPETSSATAVAPKDINFGVVFVHDREHPEATRYLHVPLLREPRSSDLRNGHEPPTGDDHEIFQDATVFSFGTKRESTAHGGGKTPDETVKNIRMRHASGTFCTLVLPSMSWEDVVAKYSAALPEIRELHGELRSRRFMGVVPNAPVELALEQL